VIPLGISLVHGTVAHQKPQGEVQLPIGATPPSLENCGVSVPCPMASAGHPVSWMFVFKLNAKSFPACGSGTRSCPFGGTVQTTATYSKFGQQYLYATSEHDSLVQGTSGCLGDSTQDPVGASFDEIYNRHFYYVIWNDQPYGDPNISHCTSH